MGVFVTLDAEPCMGRITCTTLTIKKIHGRVFWHPAMGAQGGEGD